MARLSLLLLLALPVSASGQGILPRLFGPRNSEKPLAREAPKKEAKAPSIDPRRLAEIQVEIAWLADPATFPYFLEARVHGAGMEVRGYVPSREVHDRALNLARVYSSMPVSDAVKEHPSLQVKPGQMSPQQLHSAVSSALREALPRVANQLQVQCAPTGQVSILGAVPTHEDRLAVSHALRRLYGCTSVQNLTQVPGAPRLPQVVTKSPPAQQPALEPALPPRTDVQATGASRTKAEPMETKDTTVVASPAVAPPPATPALAARLRKKIEETCPGVKSVRIDVVSPTELRIEVTAATEDQVGTFAGRILMMSELQDYKSDLQFKVMP